MYGISKTTDDAIGEVVGATSPLLASFELGEVAVVSDSDMKATAVWDKRVELIS
jgi:hypothetical protein